MPSPLSARTLEADPTQTMPCMVDPTGWDIPHAEHKGEYPLIRHRLIDALKGCSSCPALDWCRTAAHRDPPLHHCVQGGEIWPGFNLHRGKGSTAAEARERARKPVPYSEWQPTMVPFSGRAEAA
jgi:hypothetical protein